MDGWREVGEPWFADSGVRPAFHNNQNKQPLTEVRSAELLQPPRLCFADFLEPLPLQAQTLPIVLLVQPPGHVFFSLSLDPYCQSDSLPFSVHEPPPDPLSASAAHQLSWSICDHLPCPSLEPGQ